MTSWGTFFGTSPWGGTGWGGVGTSEGLPDINGSFERGVLGFPGEAELWSVTRIEHVRDSGKTCNSVTTVDRLGAEMVRHFHHYSNDGEWRLSWKPGC